jgi:hypothetical protein
MNLWAKRIGQLTSLSVALFFFCCEDEANLLGYKNPNSKFEASYVEIPLESSVLLLDSQHTSNFFYQNETNRLLVGQYADEKLGQITANAFTQFFTNSTAKLAADAAYDSVTLTLVLDKYHYGSRQVSSQQSISVYELNDSLSLFNRKNYFNRSEIPVKPTVLGTKSFIVDPDSLDYYTGSRSQDSTFTVTLPLDAAFGQRIFESALRWRDSVSADDDTFVRFSKFTKAFYGLALKSDAGDKILGISTSSYVSVHYHTAKDTSEFNLGFFSVANFSQIKNDLSTTELAGLTQYAQDFYPADNMRYIQSGTGIYTKLDFGKFFEFADTVPNVIITSAEVSIEPISDPGQRTPPGNYILRLLKPNNFIERYASKSIQDSTDLLFYNPSFPAHTGTLRVDVGANPYIDSDSALFVNGDDNSPLLEYSSTDKSINGNFALFFQQLSRVRENKRRFQYFLLNPAAPAVPNSKSVNRVIFPKDNVKLKIYYTKPTTPLN